MNMISRRRALAITAGAATVAGAAVAAVRVFGDASPDPTPGPSPAAGPSGSSAPSLPTLSLPSGGIDEVFEGRRIQISLGTGGHHDGGHSPGLPTVRIDGQELHLMPNADNSWISVVNHYQTFPSTTVTSTPTTPS
ncbi:tyrosinase family oxidase copper chaperone [Streptomyces sp. NPDC101733]|uniref:tyrosinase family oxidase copper chaperone n=1 Tax=unclassified Streptomyces TaxID=2593676 RepID=UPI00380985DC